MTQLILLPSQCVTAVASRHRRWHTRPVACRLQPCGVVRAAGVIAPPGILRRHSAAAAEHDAGAA